MTADRIEGALRVVKGRALQVWGRLTGDRPMVLRGHATAFAGAAQASFGRAMSVTRGPFGLRRRVGV